MFERLRGWFAARRDRADRLPEDLTEANEAVRILQALRRSDKVAPLYWDDKLALAARRRATELVGRLDTDAEASWQRRPRALGLEKRMAHQGYRSGVFVELVVVGPPDAYGAFSELVSSATHIKAMAQAGHNSVGIGRALGLSGEGYWVMILAYVPPRVVEGLGRFESLALLDTRRAAGDAEVLARFRLSEAEDE